MKSGFLDAISYTAPEVIKVIPQPESIQTNLESSSSILNEYSASSSSGSGGKLKTLKLVEQYKNYPNPNDYNLETDKGYKDWLVHQSAHNSWLRQNKQSLTDHDFKLIREIVESHLTKQKSN